MADSKLVTSELYTQNRSVGRVHNGKKYAVDTITIHCTAGNNNRTGESTAKYFMKSSVSASATYCIGGKGDICQNVREADRPWTTGGSYHTYTNADGITENGSLNDYHAITMEVASNKDATVVNDAAIEATIALCVDIMQRHGKTKAVWFGDDAARTVAYKPAANEMKFTWHCWFANKSCPGKLLKSKFQYIIDSINNKLAEGAQQTMNYISTVLTTAECKKKMWDMLMTEIGNEYGVAGLMGNIQAESNFRSNNLQNTYEKSLGLTDEQYTEHVDNGTYTNFIKDSAGYGLAQWTYWSRKQDMLAYMHDKRKVGIGDTVAQIEYLIKEIKNYDKVWPVLKSATSVREASNAVLLYYEAPASKNEQKTQDTRASYGEAIYNEFTTHTPTVVDTIEAGDTVKIKPEYMNEAITLITSALNGPLKVSAVNGDIATMSIVFNMKTSKLTETKSEPVLADCTPYIVKVKRVLPLPYYKQPKDGAEINGYITSPGTYTIVAQTSDNTYGKLKSGAGYVKLSDVDRV